MRNPIGERSIEINTRALVGEFFFYIKQVCKAAIEQLEFPCEIKKKLVTKGVLNFN